MAELSAATSTLFDLSFIYFEKFLNFDIVALSFLFDKYCSIMK